MKKVDLYYERYMDSYDILESYKGHGNGTLFSGDSGYCDDYDNFIYKLKCDLEFHKINLDEVTFIKTGPLSTFIKNLQISYS